MVENGTTSISPAAVTKLLDRALLDGGVTPKRIEVKGKTIRIVTSSEDVEAAMEALTFGVLLDAGLVDYRLDVGAGL